MMAPLVVLWPAAVLGTYLAATAIANGTYDAELRDMVRAVAEEARVHGGDGSAARQLPVLNALRDDPVDRFYVQLARESGEVIAGDAAIPAFAKDDPPPGAGVQFREGFMEGENVRVAYTVAPGASGAFLVQVAEPLKRRRALVGDVTAIVMVVIAMLVPATVAMVWFGLRHGLTPLLRLRERVEARDPDDLSPIPPGEVPLEIAPLVNTLNRQLERVRANLEAQRRFVADAAHQMRTPLAGLKTQAEAAARENSLEETRERLARIEESADRLGRVMAQLLALARADDALARPAPKEPCELNAMLREVCAPWADRALGKEVVLGFDAAATGAVVQGAPLLLRELFANLIDNAIRYTPSGGEVAVIVNAGPPVTVVVQDSGIGIAPADRALVFDRFYRVLGTGENGSGLGLSIVKAIADLHGAEVRVESGAGDVGARFVVTFAA